MEAERQQCALRELEGEIAELKKNQRCSGLEIQELGAPQPPAKNTSSNALSDSSSLDLQESIRMNSRILNDYSPPQLAASRGRPKAQSMVGSVLSENKRQELQSQLHATEKDRFIPKRRQMDLELSHYSLTKGSPVQKPKDVYEQALATTLLGSRSNANRNASAGLTGGVLNFTGL